LTAVAGEGYVFDHWSEDLAGDENPTTVTMDADKLVHANFVSTERHTLAADVYPSATGTVTLEPEQPGEGYVLNETVAVTAVAGEGYVFDHWGGDLTGDENPTTITMDANKLVYANFVSTERHALVADVDPSAAGTVTLEPEQPGEGYVLNETVAVTAVAGEGYVFDHWGGDLADDENPATIVMDGDKLAHAYFVTLSRYALNVDAYPSAAGAVNLEPVQPGEGYIENEQVTLTAVATQGYRFNHWEEDLTGSTSPASLIMDSSKTVTAVFDAYYPLSVIVDPADADCTVTLEPEQPVEGYIENEQVALTAVASQGYRFNHWEGDLTGSTSPASLVMDGSKTVTAVFDAYYPLSVIRPLSVIVCTIDVEPAQSADGYLEGTAVSLIAKAAPSYVFDHWGGDLAGQHNPATTPMTSGMQVRAYFVKSTPFPWWLVIVGLSGLALAVLSIFLVRKKVRARA
jgi:hypothetical protein